MLMRYGILVRDSVLDVPLTNALIKTYLSEDKLIAATKLERATSERNDVKKRRDVDGAVPYKLCLKPMPRQTTLDGYEPIVHTKRSEQSERIDVKKCPCKSEFVIRYF